MKKYTLLTILSAAAVLASCNRVESLPQPQFGGDQFILSLDSGALVTKAGETNAPEFETKIDHFDFFFFEDAAGTQPTDGMHGRVSGASKQLNTGIGEAFEALRLGTHYVYILANYPDEIDHTNNWELEDILALPVSSKLLTSFDETGVATFCNYLVMDSYDEATGKYTTELTPTMIQEQRECVVGLSRIAAKLTLTLDIEEKVIGSDGTERETWIPIIRDLEAYYVNALNNNSTVSAEPVRRADLQVYTEDQYLTYPENYHMTKVTDYKYVLDDVYTYPQTWSSEDNGEPYFKVYLPWMSDLRGSSNFYYKVTVPRSESNKWTINRNSWYNVEVKLSVVDAVDDYVEVTANYTVHPWSGSSVPGAPPFASARFFDVPNNEYEIYSQEELTIPFSSSSAVSVYFTEISYTHYRVGTGVTYTFNYTESDGTTPLTLPREYDGATISPTIAQDRNPYSLVIDGKTVKFSHSLNNIYTVRNIKFVIKNSDGGEPVTVTIKQHPAIEVKSYGTNNVFVNGHFARATEGVHVNGSTQKMGAPFVLHYSEEAGQTRYHSDDNAFRQATGYNDSAGYWYPGATNYSGSEGNSPQVVSRVASGRYGWIEGDVNRSVPYLIEITVSAFNENNNTYTYKEDGVTVGPKKFILGDPRVEGGSRFAELANVSGSGNKGAYLYKSSTLRDEDGNITTGDAEYRAWEEPMKILMSSTKKEDGAIIAPRFIVSSFYNAQPASLTFEECQKRAATYQEAGYPAGRWRIPTEAEIMFMVQQQQRSVIPALWGVGSNYWCADGRYVTVASSGSDVNFHAATATDRKVNRFVYDIWYWGDEPMEDQETYWPNKHLEAPNQN